MTEIIFFIVLIFLYVLIPFVFLLQRKVAIKKTKEESSIEWLKKCVKHLKICIIVLLILSSISFVLRYDYIKTDVIIFANNVLAGLFMAYFFLLNIFIIIIPCIKDMEKELEN